MAQEKLFLTNKPMPQERMKGEVFPGFYIQNPHVPFYMYAPITIALLAFSVFWVQLLWWEIAVGIFAAVAFWTIFEYIMHRYIFHWKPQQPFFKKLLYTIHHGHHDYPNDSRLMLVGPVVSFPAFVVLWAIGYLIAGHYIHPFMAGMASCYMFYDWLHYASHHYNFDNRIFQLLKSHHARHHYEDNERNFAFTTLFWDTIFGTTIKKK